jgi:hypothetical protein
MWSSCIDPRTNRISHYVDNKPVWENELTYRQLLLSNITSNLIVMGIKDHLTSGNFNPILHNKPVMVEYLENLFENYNNKKFILQ